MKNSFFLVLIFFTYSCTNKSGQDNYFDNSILVQIDNHIILKNEFIKRAEYVLRPDYCNKSNNVHKQIVLNSLIAEKLLAIKGEAFFDDSQIKNYLKGLREQNMREKLFFTKTDSIQIDNFKLNQYRKTAERIYTLSFINLSEIQADKAKIEIEKSSKSIHNFFDQNNLNTKEISFFEETNFILSNEIFSQPHEKNDIIGPLRMDNGTFILIRVEDWQIERNLSEASQKEYVENIREHLRWLKVRDIYSTYIHKIMENKTLKFNEANFSKLINYFYHEQLQFEKSKKDLIEKAIWSENTLILTGKYSLLDIDESETIFSVDKKDWKMNDLQKLINLHPLTFRNKKISKEKFPAEFKNAIADLIRDYYLTLEAYKLNLDKDPFINQYIKMWRDSFIASAVKTSLLQSELSNNDIKQLEPLINQLFNDYSDKIIINFNLLDQINLSSIPMIVKQNSPYQSPIPQFPILTDSYKINYGTKRN